MVQDEARWAKNMSAPPIKKARSLFLFLASCAWSFAAALARSKSSLTALFVIKTAHLASVFSSRSAALVLASAM